MILVAFFTLKNVYFSSYQHINGQYQTTNHNSISKRLT